MEHAPASNTGLSLFPPGFQAHFQGGVRGSPGTGLGSPIPGLRKQTGFYEQLTFQLILQA